MVPETKIETKVIELTPKHRITLSQITHYQLIDAMNKAAGDRYEHLRPALVDGFTHELAYQNVASYKTSWDAYINKKYDGAAYVWFGASWQTAGLDMEDGEWEAEIDAAVKMAKKLKLPVPDTDDLMDLGALAGVIIDNRVGSAVLNDLLYWLRKGAGLLDTSEVEAERKSQEGNGEQPAPVGSVGGDEGKARKRR